MIEVSQRDFFFCSYFLNNNYLYSVRKEVVSLKLFYKKINIIHLCDKKNCIFEKCCFYTFNFLTYIFTTL